MVATYGCWIKGDSKWNRSWGIRWTGLSFVVRRPIEIVYKYIVSSVGDYSTSSTLLESLSIIIIYIEVGASWLVEACGIHSSQLSAWKTWVNLPNVVNVANSQLATQQSTGLSQMPRHLVEAASDPNAASMFVHQDHESGMRQNWYVWKSSLATMTPLYQNFSGTPLPPPKNRVFVLPHHGAPSAEAVCLLRALQC